MLTAKAQPEGSREEYLCSERGEKGCGVPLRASNAANQVARAWSKVGNGDRQAREQLLSQAHQPLDSQQLALADRGPDEVLRKQPEEADGGRLCSGACL